MIIAVAEYVERDSIVWFVDITKFDVNDAKQSRYYDAISAAMLDCDKSAVADYDSCLTSSENQWDVKVSLPCQVDDSVTLYIE
jgi:hypothetical protein